MINQRIHDWLRTENAQILIVFSFAFFIRLIALDRICLISRDGIQYVTLAKLYLSGSFLEALSHPFHPLYPVSIALVKGAIGDPEMAGKLVSLATGSLTVIPLYLIGKIIYDARAGFIAGILLAFQPYAVRFSVDVLSDSLFLFFCVLSLYLGIKALSALQSLAALSIGSGICGGLSYLTRPEGMAVIAFIAAWYLLQTCIRGTVKPAKGLLALACLLVSFTIIASPYPLFIKRYTGTWHISMKPSVVKSFESNVPVATGQTAPASSLPRSGDQGDESSFKAPAKPSEPFRGHELIRSLTYPPLRFIETYHYLLFAFLLIGIKAEYKHKAGSQSLILLAIPLAYLVGLCYLYYTVSYVSRRHFLPPLTLSLPIAAVGFWEVRYLLFSYWDQSPAKWSRVLAKNATFLLVLIIALTLLPKALKSQGIEKLPLKEAGLWIKTNSPKTSPVIMCNEPLVAYYAEGTYLPVPDIGYGEFVRYVSANQVRYVVFEERDITRGKNFLSLLSSDTFRPISFDSSKVLIYQVMNPS